MRKKHLLKFLIIILIGATSMGGLDVRAQEEPLVTDFEHFYDDVKIEKLAQLYWHLNMFDINDDNAVDNYIKITECDIYKEYIYNELEWSGVRERARNYLRENVGAFPTRFKFEQPLRFGDYNSETNMFALAPDYQIDGIRKFEVYSDDFSVPQCVNQRKGPEIEGYPKALLVELNQPLNLKEIPVKKSTASRYIEEKMNVFWALPENTRDRDALYELRTAFIVMKIKVFSYKGTERIMNARTRATVYAMLEGYEIYADKDHKELLYFENFIRQSDEKPLDIRLKEQFESLQRKRNP